MYLCMYNDGEPLEKKTVELNFKKNANDLFFSFFTGKRERENF